MVALEFVHVWQEESDPSYNIRDFLTSLILKKSCVSVFPLLWFLLYAYPHLTFITLMNSDFTVPSGGVLHTILLGLLKISYNNLHISMIKK